MFLSWYVTHGQWFGHQLSFMYELFLNPQNSEVGTVLTGTRSTLVSCGLEQGLTETNRQCPHENTDILNSTCWPLHYSLWLLSDVEIQERPYKGVRSLRHCPGGHSL